MPAEASDAELSALRAELEELEAEGSELTQQLQRVKEECSRLAASLASRQSEVERLKSAAVTVQHTIEEEEDSIKNVLTKQLEQLRREKEQLAQQVEREEEHLTNSLQRKLHKLQAEKQDLERHLRAEERYIRDKLKQQLRQAQEQTKLLEQQLSDAQLEGAPTPRVGTDDRSSAGELRLQKLIATTNNYKATVGERAIALDGAPVAAPGVPAAAHGALPPAAEEHPSPALPDSDADSSISESTARSAGGCSLISLQTMPGSCRSSAAQGADGTALQLRRSQAAEDTLRQLHLEIARLQHLRKEKETEAATYLEKCESLRRELEHLSQDNFLKEVKAQRLKQELERTSEERNQLFVSSEYLAENEVTTGMRMRAEHRSRRASAPGGPPLPTTPASAAAAGAGGPRGVEAGMQRSASTSTAGAPRRPSLDRLSLRAHTQQILMQSPALSPEPSPAHSSSSSRAGSRGISGTPLPVLALGAASAPSGGAPPSPPTLASPHPSCGVPGLAREVSASSAPGRRWAARGSRDFTLGTPSLQTPSRHGTPCRDVALPFSTGAMPSPTGSRTPSATPATPHSLAGSAEPSTPPRFGRAAHCPHGAALGGPAAPFAAFLSRSRSGGGGAAAGPARTGDTPHADPAAPAPAPAAAAAGTGS
eukprot:TRINITY_DN5778_c1_g1_i1.p1 TRINITY_DN5778_c1_g1~~TRINITY_DN5778_c1_g1_i1.p1  ORF type:complete len:652 (+),score=192.78 TRINITY_DN5778_c1_g1_i1:93-2048(+)